MDNLIVIGSLDLNVVAPPCEIIFILSKIMRRKSNKFLTATCQMLAHEKKNYFVKLWQCSAVVKLNETQD